MATNNWDNVKLVNTSQINIQILSQGILFFCLPTLGDILSARGADQTAQTSEFQEWTDNPGRPGQYGTHSPRLQ